MSGPPCEGSGARPAFDCVTRQEVRLVQASFAQIDALADKLAASFYRRLFELDPTLISLFKTDMRSQGVKFIEKLAVAVKGLEDLDAISGFVQELGRRHAGYGAKIKDYGTAGDALLWALEQEFGHAFTPELRAAWSATYETLCGVMIAGGEAHAS
jgi:hemoglobin-like flavoprotein